MADLQPSDKILVNRDGVDYQTEIAPLLEGGDDGPVHWDDIEDKPCIPECNCPEFTTGHPTPNPKDGDVFSDSSSCPPRLLIYSEEKSRWIAVGEECPVEAPWAGHDGGVWHVKNLSSSRSLSLRNGPYKSWDPDGTNEAEITEIPTETEKVFVTGPDASYLWYLKWNFELRENTDVSRVTNMYRLFGQECGYRDANRNLEGWSVCNVTCMKYMFENMDYRIYSDLSNWGVENCPDPGWSEDYANSFDGIQPKWGEPNGPCSCKGNSSSVRKADSEQEEWEAYLKRKEEWVAQAEQRKKEQAD